MLSLPTFQYSFARVYFLMLAFYANLEPDITALYFP